MDFITCTLCDRSFSSHRGLSIHQANRKSRQIVTNRCHQDALTEDVFTNDNTVIEINTILETSEINIEIESEIKANLPEFTKASTAINSVTNNISGNEFSETINRVYNEIVQWRKNFFKLPSGNAAKMFIKELTLWLEHQKIVQRFLQT